jgi:hypothetical protein
MTVIVTIFRTENRRPYSWYDILKAFILFKVRPREIKISPVIKSTPIIRPPEFVIVHWENSIWAITREDILSRFATCPRKEIPLISKPKEISPELSRAKSRRRYTKFFVEEHICVCHDEFFTCEPAFLFFDDGFVGRDIHKNN